MARSYWKTGSTPSPQKDVRWPSAKQLVGQLGIALIVVLLWAGGLAVYLRSVTVEQPIASPPIAESQVAVEVVVRTATSTATPTPPPTSTGTATPTGASTAPARENTVVAEPSPTSTDTPSPTPTDTPQPPTNTPSPPAEAAEVSFANDVFPIIERRCIKCHGGQKEDGTFRIEEGLKLTSHANILAGSWNGPVVEPGNVAGSFLFEQIETGEMPKKEPDLLPAEIRIIKAWIEAGAPDN